MSQAIFLQQSAAFGPGRLQPLLRDFGIGCRIVRLDRGDAIDGDLNDVTLLIVLGGEEGVPTPPALSHVLREAVDVDRPVIAIGRGAQQLAEAAGAKVYANAKPGATATDATTPVSEYGFGPVNFPFPGGTEPVMYGMVDGTPFFHCHSDTFDLPKFPPPPGEPKPGPPPPTGNSLLAASSKTRNQAFRFKSHLFGFQFHFELDDAAVNALASNAALFNSTGYDAAALSAQWTQHKSRYLRAGEKLTNNLVQFLRAY